ncbi:hypothetical protein HCN44_005572 [Aphidius gifuensis]|uniref:Uncharacterized protein n=1 Tax=Aphidius gifuensis TaxID=684658 RepID=A0A835CY60_APHGI|nr:glutathione hydrolase 1 proenzyme-like [Aphidius gifuensis]KAF7997295.1 hypothetical protein HCN44_005572 [Aphidius gifuensis]
MFGLKKSTLIGSFVGLCIGIGLIILIIFTFIKTTNNDDDHDKSWGDKFISKSILGKFKKAAVASNGVECSEIGMNMLKKNGSAVDAAIATLLCEGVASLHSMGLGGGFLMTIWDASKKKSVFLNARETAPAASHKNMFEGNATLSQFGGKAIGIPGELLGYWEAHKYYGKLPWRELFLPTIELCENGIVVNEYLANTLRRFQNKIINEPTLKDILIDKKTNETWIIGDRIKRPILKETLKRIAEDGPGIFYNGTMGEDLIKEIKEVGGIMDMNDLKNYRIKWSSPIASKFDKLTMYTAPLPGSGVILNLIMNILYGITSTKDESIFCQRLVETFKWGYAKRTELGDDNFVDINGLLKNLTSPTYAKEIRQEIVDNWTSKDPKYYGAVFATPDDSGTSHVSVLADDGSAVSVTSTINQVLGAMIRSKSTGIIFNDQMDDFSAPGITNGFDLPPSPANFIEPGKRPLSSMVPTIIVDDEGQVQLVIGAAGGTKITTSVALAIILNIWKGYNIKEAVDARRLHHQLLPMTIEAEPGFNQSILDYLIGIGHNTTFYSGIGSAITAVSRKNYNGITANSDYRRQGTVSGF